MAGSDFEILSRAEAFREVQGICCGLLRVFFPSFEKKFEGRHIGSLGGDLRIVEVEKVPGLRGVAHADVREVRAGAHGAHLDGLLVHVIAGDGAAFAPAARDIRADTGGVDLLRVAINTAVGDVDTVAFPFQ